MKRIEVKLSLPVVAPLLDVIKTLGDTMGRDLAAPLAIADLDREFRESWTADLLETQNAELQILMALFDDNFFTEGVIGLDEKNAEPVVRACAAVRRCPSTTCGTRR